LGWHQELLQKKVDYGNSAFDVRQRAAATLFYEFPFGKSASGLRAQIERSWQLNLSGVWSTGLPFTVLNAIGGAISAQKSASDALRSSSIHLTCWNGLGTDDIGRTTTSQSSAWHDRLQARPIAYSNS
jgi:hypothetical protein